MKQSASLIIAFLALTVAAVGWFRPVKTAPAVVKTEVVRVAAPAVPTPAPPQEQESPSIVPVRDPALVDALTSLQTRLAQMEDQLNEMREGWQGLARRGMVPLTEEYRAELRGQVLDSSRPWGERIAAYRMLRRHNEVTDDIALAVVQIAETGPDDRAKMEALRNLDGLTNGVIKPTLLAALGNQENPEMRAAAADALSGFAGDPAVDQWLRNLAANDEDPRVQREAKQALYEKFRNMDQESLQRAVTDPTLPPDEQVAALRRLRNDARSSEVVNSMIDLYMASEDPGLRAEILRGMDGVTDPTVKAPLLNWLAKDPDPSSRSEAAENLRHMREDPDVKAWLEWSAANDESEVVRRAASAALQGREPRERGWDRGRRGR